MREAGTRTTEFWVTLLVITLGAATAGLGQFYGDNLPEWARAVTVAAGSIMTVLAALGYTAARTLRKNHADDTTAIITTSEDVVKTAEADKITAIAGVKKVEAERDQGSASVGLLAIVTFVLLFAAGCSLQMKTHDPVTESQIIMTISHYEQNGEWMKAQVPDRAAEVDIRVQAEVTRLQKWLEYEKAKELTDAE